MIMSRIFVISLAVSLFSAVLTGNGSALAGAVQTGAQAGVNLAISIAGSICLWTGVGALMERLGITAMLGKGLRPLLGRLFPECQKNETLRGSLSANICANLLGLGNAATPMGIRAAKELADPNRPGLATDSMCRLVVLNTASIQLIPANVAAVRSSLGCERPFDILIPVWITSLCSASLGVAMAWILGKVWRRD